MKKQGTYINTLTQYIEIIKKLKRNYPTHPILHNPVNNVFLFRGHSDSNYELIPSLFRKTEEKIEHKRIVNDKYLAYGEEKRIIQSFLQCAKSEVDIEPTDLFHWAEYAQHYGVPTRFLDWTHNPLVGLYFACTDNRKKDGAVWIVHGVNYDSYCAQEEKCDKEDTRGEVIKSILNGQVEIRYPVQYSPYYVIPRMSAQSSHFLVWGTTIEPLEKMFKDDKYWMNLPEKEGIRTFGSDQHENILFKILIKGKDKQSMLRELDLVGISARTLFPGLDGLGRYIEWKYRFYYPEVFQQF